MTSPERVLSEELTPRVAEVSEMQLSQLQQARPLNTTYQQFFLLELSKIMINV